ncbi:MAG: hypothetical protein KKE64_06470 [Candidatus Omnitrophica bacterium]|nr:hypothetical protein [Candidatus Omnitrophota bacterium]
MRKFIAILLFFSFFLAPYTVWAWEEIKGEHFIIYYLEQKPFAEDVLSQAERYYRQIASDLGYSRNSNFWTWDKRVKIYIYTDQQSFLAATNQPLWSQGLADYTNKMIISYNWNKGFSESLLPHEIAHLIFRDFVGFKGEVPLWLDEGVAQWSELPKRSISKSVARSYLKKRAFLPLIELTKLTQEGLKELDQNQKNRPMLSNPETIQDSPINIFYLQAASLVGFLIERYGTDSFAEFCRKLRDGSSLNQALTSAYSAHISGIEELQERWLAYLRS